MKTNPITWAAILIFKAAVWGVALGLFVSSCDKTLGVATGRHVLRGGK